MPSPFPGMNPYPEQEDVWHNFHKRFIPLVASVLGVDYIYEGNPHPRLDGDNAIWARQFIPAASS